MVSQLSPQLLLPGLTLWYSGFSIPKFSKAALRHCVNVSVAEKIPEVIAKELKSNGPLLRSNSHPLVNVRRKSRMPTETKDFRQRKRLWMFKLRSQQSYHDGVEENLVLWATKKLLLKTWEMMAVFVAMNPLHFCTATSDNVIASSSWP
jgi:hypothetical protein